ncbi:MAG TPA: AraC family transcriptional regulator [Albidovulum sp.]|uniref:AraC family transcriptional regulator n=1 Tax=Albidovulum sp. TaxID=1872424 RepID=UPI002C81C3F5|nr:AraC family transcriptional regulator [Albidovulum sp.]
MGPYEGRLLRVIDHIHANPAGDLSLDALADVAALSRFHFHRVFHAMTGETAADAVRRIRMHRAACWLVQTNWRPDDIARRAGYPSGKSFARAFSAHYGLTPSAFRKRGELTSPLLLHQRKGHQMFDVTIRPEPARRLAAVAHKGPYMQIGQSFEKLGTILGGRDLWGRVGGLVGVYYDDPSATPPKDLRSHAGAVLPGGEGLPEGLEEVRLPEGRYACLRFKGHYSGLQAAYDYLFGPWLAQSGEEPGEAPAIEVYLNTPADTAPDDLLTDVCMSLKS